MKDATLADLAALVATGAAEARTLAATDEVRRADARVTTIQAAERRHRLNQRAAGLLLLHELDAKILLLELSPAAEAVEPILRELRAERRRLVAESRWGR